MVITNSISPSLKYGLQFLVMWPDMAYATVKRFLYLTIFLIMQYFQYHYVFTHFKIDEIQNFVDSLPSTLAYSLTIVKMIMIWKNCRVIREILAAIDTDWCECVNVNRYLQAMTSKASISHFCSNAMLGFNTIAAVIYILGDYALSIVHNDKSDNDTTRPFPIKLTFPFEAEQSPIYELLVVASIHNASVVGVLRGIVIYIPIMLEIFILCFAGEYLSLKVNILELEI
ncbi:PREDICTED: uncharacterized protein LOC106749155 [Dinoponera quadriceps]|uniref:Uncharacterized protein LOC106749155 n=1 Tax=Dinoponera quadriceps TaxID=609295 RepID=A0A6P3Y0F3_DINQU|nr:PREDICTED: uncharacterized protein LOC106749155 [Dinoponera quadriceps]